jgi:CAAX protease family protein
LAWGIPLALTAILFQTLGAFGFLRLWRYEHPGHAIPLVSAASNGAVLAFSLAVSAPLVLALLAFAVTLSRVPLVDYLALKWPRWRDVWAGVIALAVVLLGTGLLATITGEQTPGFISDTFTSARDAGLLPLLAVSFVFLGPLQEELLFRGFFFRGFAPALGTWPAIVITAAVWALSHGQYQWFFVGEIFALGLVFGWLRGRSGSTILPLMLHAAVNAMAIVGAAIS